MVILSGSPALGSSSTLPQKMKTTKFLGILFGIFALLCGLVGAPGNDRAPERLSEVLSDRSVDWKNPASRAQMVERMKAIEVRELNKARLIAQSRGKPLREKFPSGKVRELVGLDEDGDLLYVETKNVNAAISTGADQLHLAPHSLDGSGLTVGVWDADSALVTHQEFNEGTTSRVNNMDAQPTDDHSTHVAGTIAAAGVDANAKGMVFAATIDSYDWDSDGSEMAAAAATAAGQYDTKLYLSNHSYGYSYGWRYDGGWIWTGTGTDQNAYDPDFGQYSSLSVNMDVIAYNAPYYLIFWAAGNENNDGPNNGNTVTIGAASVTYDSSIHPQNDGNYRNGFETIGDNGIAKNLITVGAANDAVTNGLRDPSKATIASFSSTGPTDDGRIKPDLVGNGVVLRSPVDSSDTAYRSMSGTSMASPNVTGSAALLVVKYRNLLGNDAAMRSSTLKGLLIHTATDIGNPGPDYTYGWGLVDVKTAAEHLDDAVAFPVKQGLVEDEVTTATTTKTYNFVWDESSPIRATLCWTDPAGVSQSSHDDRTPDLVNDLNLKLIAPDGTEYFPYVMPFVGTWTVASMSQNATTGVNNTDNVEQVLVDVPGQVGAWQAVVSVTGSLTNDVQQYGLLISGSATAGAVGFTAAEYITTEGGGAATISVGRFGGTAGAVSVGYATADDTAIADSDYTTTSGTLSWADGEGGTKTFNVTILNDGVSEEFEESLNLTLSNPVDATLSGTNPATLIIQDDEPIMVVTAPNGGESFLSGDATNITWSSSLGGNVSIELFKNGLLYHTIASSTPNDGLLNWTVPDLLPTGVDYRLRITSLGAGGESDVSDATFTVENLVTANIYSADMSTDPGWTLQGGWAYGIPKGNGGDPTGGNTGNNVIGYNLDGAYGNDLPETFATTTVIDCSDFRNVELSFYRWLGIESSAYDNAAIQVSNNGTTWITVWSHSSGSFTDPSWQFLTYDLSAVADLEPTVYVRWVMGATDGSVTFAGWNIDDVEIVGDTDSVGPGGELAFSLDNYVVNEDAGTAVITVERSGGSTGAASVDYATSDGTAISGTDYTTTSGTLTWADGDSSSKTFSVPINDNSIREVPFKTLNLTLTNTAGATLSVAGLTATLQIKEDDNLAPVVDAGADQTISLVGDAAPEPVAGANIFLDAGLDDGANNIWEDSLGLWSPTIDTANVTFVPDAGSSFQGITSAYDFPGGLSGIGGAEGPSLQDMGVDTQPITLEVWFKPNASASYPTNGQVIWETGGGTGIGIFYKNGLVETAHDSNQGRMSTDVSALTGEFIQVVVTYDTSSTFDNFKLYINGELRSTSSRTDTDMCGGDASGLGERGNANVGGAGNGDSNTASFDGRIAIFRSYHNQILNAAEVQQNYESVSLGIQASANLSGTVSDGDSDPLSLAWTVASGPGPVNFVAPDAANTNATFTVAGVYTLRLTADDGFDKVFDDIQITVSEPIRHILTYDGNGNDAGSAPTDANSPYYDGSLVSILDNTEGLLKNGFTFSGWNTAADGNGLPYAPAASFTINADTILYAQWTANVAGFTLSKSASTVDENGGSDTFTVVLDSQPASDVVFDVTSSDTGEATVSPTSLTFTTANWDAPQTVTITGVNDAVTANDTATVTVSVNDASSADSYDPLADQTLAVTIIDDDVPSIIIGAISGATSEAGASATFSVVLGAEPSASVSFDLSSSDTSEGTVSPTSLTFGTGDWSTPQIVTVTGVDDAVVDGDQIYTIITTAAISADPNYDGMNPDDVTVTNLGDEFTLTVQMGSGGDSVTGGGVKDPTSSPYAITATPATGYAFNNWTVTSGSARFADANSASTTVSASADATIQANFELGTYTVTFDANGGDAADPANKSVTYGESYGTLATVTRTGFTFMGWFTSAVDGSEITAVSTVAITADQTLFARWNENPVASAGDDQTINMTGSDVDWTPADAAASLTAWYDASDSQNLVLEGQNVTNWKDISGNGYDLDQSPVDPVYDGSQINGLNVIHFSATFAELYRAGIPDINCTEVSVISVGTPKASGDYPNLGSVYSTDVSDKLFLRLQNNDTSGRINSGLKLDGTNTTLASSYNAIIVDDVPVMLAAYYDGFNGVARVNGGALSTTANVADGATFTINEIQVGRDNNTPLNYHGEMIVLNSADSTLIAKVEGYLAWKWGMQATLPAAHPYSTTNATSGPKKSVPSASAILAGGVTDSDDTPTYTWTDTGTGTGTGTVTFADASSLNTEVTFSAPGTYVLRLTADDGTAQDFDDVVITVNPPVTYTVTYDGNGNTGGTAPTDGQSPYDSGVSVTVLGNTGTLLRSDYDFGGWNTASDGSGTAYSVGNTFTIADDVVFYAVWLGAFDNWVGQDSNPVEDSNGDGVPDGLAWVLGASAVSSDASDLQPTLDPTTEVDYYIFTYRRADEAHLDPNTAITAIFGNDMQTWNTAVHDGTDVIITETDDHYGTGVDRVEVKINKDLLPGDKIFTRLRVEITP